MRGDQIECDRPRTAYLDERGYTMIRFTSREVFNQLEAVLQQIADEGQRLIAPSPQLFVSSSKTNPA